MFSMYVLFFNIKQTKNVKNKQTKPRTLKHRVIFSTVLTIYTILYTNRFFRLMEIFILFLCVDMFNMGMCMEVKRTACGIWFSITWVSEIKPR